MYCLHIVLKKAALSLDDGLHPALEGHAGLGHHGRVHGGKVLQKMEVIKEALVVWAHRLLCVPK